MIYFYFIFILKYYILLYIEKNIIMSSVDTTTIRVCNIKNTEKKEMFEYNIETTIHNLKEFLSIKLSKPMNNIHILKNKNELGNFIHNSDLIIYSTSSFSIIDEKETIFYLITKNKCAMCSSKTATIVGDCKYCNCSFCLNHRLPEGHKCIHLNVCKENSFNRNKTKVLSEKCVASKV